MCQLNMQISSYTQTERQIKFGLDCFIVLPVWLLPSICGGECQSRFNPFSYTLLVVKLAYVIG